MSRKVFVLASGSVNTKKSIVEASGIQWTYFAKNPVMRYMHEPGVVIGRWETLRYRGKDVTAESVFDLKDELGAKIARQVEDGFINACSISVWPLEGYKELVDGEEILRITKCELREVSIVDVPSDHGALIILVDKSGSQIDDILELADSLEQKNKINYMTREELIRKLNLSDTATDADINLALGAAVKAKSDLEALQKKMKDDQKAQAVKLADAAESEGRIDAGMKADLLELADANFGLFEKMLGNTVKPVEVVSLSDKIRSAQAGNAQQLAGRETWSFADWQKKDPEGLASLQLSDNKKFKALYRAEHKTEWIDD